MNSSKAIVSLHRWTNFAQVRQLLHQALIDLGGIQRFVHSGDLVVIKPNLTADAPASSGGTTHVELVEALIEEIKPAQPGRIIVAEGTGRFGTSHETAFPTGGWREMAARQGVELYNLDAGPHEDHQPPKPRYPYPLPFSKLILDADVFISVPCLKTHLSADYTVALKNNYALIPQWKRSEIHRQYLLEEAITDLNRIRKADLIIVDGWDGSEGIAGGITFKRPAGARLLMAGDDPVAVDVVAREVMQLTAPTRYLSWAIEDGVGCGDLGQITLKGDPLDACRHRFLSPAEEILELHPELTIYDLNACSGCRIPALSAIRRSLQSKLLQPLTVIFGQEGEPGPLRGKTLVIGDCAERFKGKGLFVPGCPPHPEAIIQVLRDEGIVCQKCLTAVQKVLPEFSPELLAHLRVTAAGTQAFIGEQVKRGEWHLELLVGDCLSHYAQAVIERAPHFGIDPERDIIWVKGCPPSLQEIREALTRFAELLRQVPS
ncbi:MAG: DUF362 domain-containing protein [Anaerolineae bacterium]|nr:DUF362 domain-containing protein [Anaerolineae bacterium]